MTKLHQLPQHSFHVEFKGPTNVRLTRGGLSISVELGREPPYGAKLSLLYLALSTLFAVSLGCLMACLHYRVYPRVRS